MITFIIAVAVLAFALWAVRKHVDEERIDVDERLRTQAPGRFVRLTDGITHYVLEGPERGEPVVFVPGATLPLFVWNHLADEIAAAGFRVLRYDLFGRGYSDRPRRRYDLEFHRRQLRELLDVLKLGPIVNIIALAFGVPIAAAFTKQYPERVKRLAVLAPDGFGVHMAKGTQRLLALPIVGAYIFSLTGGKTLRRRLQAYSRNPAVVQELERQYFSTLAWRGFKRAVWSSVQNVPIHDAIDLYKEMRLPVHVIWGTNDRVTPYPGEARLREAFPHATLQLFDGGGHLPHYEHSAEVARGLLAFLRSNDSTAFATPSTKSRGDPGAGLTTARGV